MNRCKALTFPIMVGKNNVLHIGEMTISSYERKHLKSNYCIFCREFKENMKQHKFTKIHKENVYNVISSSIGNRLNMDCIKNICQYLPK